MNESTVVVGSGAAGVHAAQTLVDQNIPVVMLDVGVERDPYYDDNTPQESFVKLRRTDPDQYKYFLGKNWEALSAAGASVPTKEGAGKAIHTAAG